MLEQRYQLFPDQRPTPPPEPEKSEGVTDSPHPPTMTPIKEETDIELRPTAGEVVKLTNAQSNIFKQNTVNGKRPLMSTAHVLPMFMH